MAVVNDAVESDGVRLRVKEMDGLRIAKVALSRLETPIDNI